MACVLSVIHFVEARAETHSLEKSVMQDFSIAQLQALDKSTARTGTFEAKVGSTVQYGSLSIKVQACRKTPPLEKPESAAFLQIWEVPIGAKKSEWAFSGWMFASSPALSAMDHAVYDVWVLDCLNKEKSGTETKNKNKDQEKIPQNLDLDKEQYREDPQNAMDEILEDVLH